MLIVMDQIVNNNKFAYRVIREPLCFLVGSNHSAWVYFLTMTSSELTIHYPLLKHLI